MEWSALILANYCSSELDPLDCAGNGSLAQIGGRYAIEFSLEEIAHAGFRHVTVATHQAERLRNAIGDGGRWGISISYLLTPPGLPLEDALVRLASRQDVLVVAGNVMRSPCLSRLSGCHPSCRTRWSDGPARSWQS